MLKLCGINKTYNGYPILNNIDLTISTDEVTFIVGTSGAGKTTLLNIIGGLLEPDSGYVLLEGECIADALDEYRAKNVGFVFQDFNLISGLDIEENLKVSQLYSFNEYSVQSRNNIGKLLSLLGFEDKKQKVETLSGGEKQRVAFIRSIVKDSQVIIADEPTGNLDANNAHKVFSMLSENKKGRHIIVVSHDMEKALQYADRIITIDNGTIVGDTRCEKNEPASSIESKDINSFNKQLKRKTINLAAANILGYNSICRHKTKIISIVAVIAIAISSLSVVYWLKNVANTVNKGVNKYYLETDLVSVSPNIMPSDIYWNSSDVFLDNQIEDLVNKYDNSTYIMKYYSNPDSVLFVGNGKKTGEANFKQIDICDNFAERFQAYDIEGELPDVDCEIILAEDLAESLYGTNAIGKVMNIYNNLGQSVEVRVVGINHSKGPMDEFYTFVYTDTLKQLRVKEIDFILKKSVAIYPTKEQSEYNMYQMKGNINRISGDEHIIMGDFPTDESHILVSSELLEECTGKDWQNKFKDISDLDFYIDLNGFHNVKICGIYQSDNYEFRCKEKLIAEIMEPKVAGVDIYLNDKFDAEAVNNELINGGTYWSSIALANLKAQVNNETKLFRVTIMIIGIVLSMFSVAMLNSFSNISLLERRRELAIIKCLGANNYDMMAVLMYDSIVISLLAFVMSLGLTAIIVRAMTHILDGIAYVSFDYPWQSEIIISLCFFVLVVVCTIFHFAGVTRKSPAELLKE